MTFCRGDGGTKVSHVANTKVAPAFDDDTICSVETYSTTDESIDIDDRVKTTLSFVSEYLCDEEEDAELEREEEKLMAEEEHAMFCSAKQANGIDSDSNGERDDTEHQIVASTLIDNVAESSREARNAGFGSSATDTGNKSPVSVAVETTKRVELPGNDFVVSHSSPGKQYIENDAHDTPVLGFSASPSGEKVASGGVWLGTRKRRRDVLLSGPTLQKNPSLVVRHVSPRTYGAKHETDIPDDRSENAINEADANTSICALPPSTTNNSEFSIKGYVRKDEYDIDIKHSRVLSLSPQNNDATDTTNLARSKYLPHALKAPLEVAGVLSGSVDNSTITTNDTATSTYHIAKARFTVDKSVNQLAPLIENSDAFVRKGDSPDTGDVTVSIALKDDAVLASMTTTKSPIANKNSEAEVSCAIHPANIDTGLLPSAATTVVSAALTDPSESVFEDSTPTKPLEQSTCVTQHAAYSATENSCFKSTISKPVNSFTRRVNADKAEASPSIPPIGCVGALSPEAVDALTETDIDTEHLGTAYCEGTAKLKENADKLVEIDVTAFQNKEKALSLIENDNLPEAGKKILSAPEAHVFAPHSPNAVKKTTTTTTLGPELAVWTETPVRTNVSTVSWRIAIADMTSFTRKRIFSIDVESLSFDQEVSTGVIMNSPTPDFIDSGADNLPPMPCLSSSDIGSESKNASVSSSKEEVITTNKSDAMDIVAVPRDRGMSFELFSFDTQEGEQLHNTSGIHIRSFDDMNYDNEAGPRPRGDSIIYDPVSFSDGGIHEEAALTRSRRGSLILGENDEIELMNTPGFMEAPMSHHPEMSILSSSPPIQSAKNTSFAGQLRVDLRTHGPETATARDCLNPNLTQSGVDASLSQLPLLSRCDEPRQRLPRVAAEYVMPDKTLSSAVPLLTNASGTMHILKGAALSAQQTLPSALNGTISHTAFPVELLNEGGRVGMYLPEERKARIAEFHSKRKMRIWRKRIKYDCRKKLADSRPRIKGRFVKRPDTGDDNE